MSASRVEKRCEYAKIGAGGNVNAIDLFCGAGGLSSGLSAEGVRVVAGFDFDPACRWPFTANHGAEFVEANVAQITGDALVARWPKGELRLLAGCAPCQPFSTWSNGRDTTDDEKWGLLSHFGRLLTETLPEFATMENVPGLARHTVFADFLRVLKANDYYVWHGVVFCPSYGIPQQRRRLVLLASRLGPIEIIPPTHGPSDWRTVRETIGSLPPLAAGEKHPHDPLHRASAMNAVNLARIRASVPGGTWHDWPPGLRAPCHRKASGQKSAAVYGRMEWDGPAPTMTTLCYGFGNGRFGHPEQDRALTLREAALLQTFPPDYQFVAPDEEANMRTIGRLIGNAVPPDLGKVVARSFRAHLEALGQA